MERKRLRRGSVSSMAITACAAMVLCIALTGCIRSDGQIVWPNVSGPAVRESPKPASARGLHTTDDWLVRRTDGTYQASGVVGVTAGWTTGGSTEWGRMDLLVGQAVGGVKIWTALPLFYDERTRLLIGGSPSSENVAAFVDRSEQATSVEDLTFKERMVSAVFRRDGSSFRLESLDVPRLMDTPTLPWPHGRTPGR